MIYPNSKRFLPIYYKPIDYSKMPLTFRALEPANIVLSSFGWPSAVTLDYKKNNGDWTTYTIGTQLDLTKGEMVSFSGANTTHFSSVGNNYYQFQMTGTIEAEGNIQSLMNFSNNTTNGCYSNLFKECTSLLKAPELPATGLAERCYQNMFNGCSNLSTVPSILPATTLNTLCCERMFAGCKNISTAPILPATGLAQYCYIYMFAGCTSLTAAPILPATTLAKYCYRSMFQGCTNLSTAPALPATTLANQCYEEMFSNCSSLSSVNVSFTDWNNGDSTMYWLRYVAPSGIFYKPSALIPNTYNWGIPSGWTLVNK